MSDLYFKILHLHGLFPESSGPPVEGLDVLIVEVQGGITVGQNVVQILNS